jgi:hypothetical protein
MTQRPSNFDSRHRGAGLIAGIGIRIDQPAGGIQRLPVIACWTVGEQLLSFLT